MKPMIKNIGITFLLFLLMLGLFALTQIFLIWTLSMAGSYYQGIPVEPLAGANSDAWPLGVMFTLMSLICSVIYSYFIIKKINRLWK